MGYISLPSNYNAIIAITIYYCVILQMVILHNAIKTFQNGVFVFFFKKNKNLFLFKKPEFEKTGGLELKKTGFSQP